MQKKIYIIAGENSGDFIGAGLIDMLESKNIEFYGVGGTKMIEAGLASLFDIAEINLMGFFEIIPKIWRIRKLINKTCEDIIKIKPNLLITIDSPGFTFRVAHKVRKLLPNLKMIHIVAPSVWAYKPGRAKKYARIYDHLLTLLPFEPPYFIAQGLKATHIGHPVLTQHFYASELEKLESRIKFGANETQKIICITPGSRAGEIKRLLPIIVTALKQIKLTFSDLKIIFVIAQAHHEEIIKSYLADSSSDYLFTNERLRAFSAADLAIAKSGTNTLEIAASRTPLIVIYKLNYLTYLLAKFLMKIPYISILNIIKNEAIMPELIQDDCSSTNIATLTIDLLSHADKSQAQVQASAQALTYLKVEDEPTTKAANIILSYL